MAWTTHTAGQQWTAADANYLGTRILETGSLASRPASGAQVGQHYYASDTNQEFLWNGSYWAVAVEQWTTCTPRLVIGNATYCYNFTSSVSSCAYKRDNGRCHVKGAITIGTGSTWTTEILALTNLPFVNSGTFGGVLIGTFYYNRAGTQYVGTLINTVMGADIGGGTAVNVTNGAMALASGSTNLAFQPASGHTFSFDFSYVVAS